jgi:hypothetical protein
VATAVTRSEKAYAMQASEEGSIVKYDQLPCVAEALLRLC